MALFSDGTGGQADKIATGGVGQRPAGAAGMIRHCQNIDHQVQEPGSTLEYWDVKTSRWQQLATFFEVDGVEITHHGDINVGVKGYAPSAPGIKDVATVEVPVGYDRHFIVSTMGFQCTDGAIDPDLKEQSYQMTVWANDDGGSPTQIAFNTTQPSYKGEGYLQSMKFSLANTGVYTSPVDKKTIFKTKCNYYSKIGAYGPAPAVFDINLSVLSWRTVK